MIKLRNALKTSCFIGLLVLNTPLIVQASDKVSSPNIDKGKAEFEYRSGYNSDDNPVLDGIFANKLVANYGITDRLRPEVKLLISNTPNDRVTGGELSLRWQFLKPKDKTDLSASLDNKYKFYSDAGKADQIEIRLLASKNIGIFSHVMNIGFEEEFGEHSSDGLSIETAWKTSYKINTYLAPGVEIYGNTGNLRYTHGYDGQEYQIGPALAGALTDSVKYDIGYLFGISEAATDGRVKFLLSYSTKF